MFFLNIVWSFSFILSISSLSDQVHPNLWDPRKALEKEIVKMYHGGGSCSACEMIMSTFISYENIHNELPHDFIYTTWYLSKILKNNFLI